MRADVVLGRGLPVAGPVLRLDGSLSFWGGVDPSTGCLSDPRSPLYGHALRGTVFMVAQPTGSSSSSAIVLELIHRRIAPAALVLGAVDAIVGLGILVAEELGLPAVPLLHLSAEDQRSWPQDGLVSITQDGRLTLLSNHAAS